MMRTFACVRNA